MSEGPDSTKPFRANVQRTPSGTLLGAAVMIGAEDLPFVGSDTERLVIEKKQADNGLIITIRSEDV